MTDHRMLEILLRARSRIADPARWSREYTAEDADGEETCPHGRRR